MKKVLSLLAVAVVIIVWSCSPKTAPPAATTTPAITPSVDIATTAPAAPESGDTAMGHATFIARCAKCHKLKDPGNYTSVRWVSIMNPMAFKAKLDSNEKKNVLAYVQANAKKG